MALKDKSLFLESGQAANSSEQHQVFQLVQRWVRKMDKKLGIDSIIKYPT